VRPVALGEHAGAVTCLAITPDAALAVSGGLDGTVRLWDLGGGKLAHTFATGHGQVHALALAGDGRRLLTGGSGGSLRVWDLRERRLLRMAPPWETGRVERLAVTPDGRTAAAVLAGAVALYDLAGREAPRRVPLGDAAGSVAVAADGKSVRLSGGARSVAFTPDGKTLAVGGGDRVVRLYDLASGDFRGELPGHSHPVVALAFNRGATLLATASRNTLRWDNKGEVKLWAAGG
jgi:WD40 repeat protein